jgi:hypothetical protein
VVVGLALGVAANVLVAKREKTAEVASTGAGHVA